MTVIDTGVVVVCKKATGLGDKVATVRTAVRGIWEELAREYVCTVGLEQVDRAVSCEP